MQNKLLRRSSTSVIILLLILLSIIPSISGNTEKMSIKSLEITQNLRKQGLSVDMDLLNRGISKSLKYASSINVDKIIIVGQKELDDESVTVRDMKTGKQELVKINKLYQKMH